ncbi:hypothetical protein LCGC14_2925010 [marine sediment metagenome]|uniref:Uncharacterized protein n=1 Tax=marine sediment metagenome TaxID=412755 RepID=A0A0F8ZVB8_9ZZZZ
MSYVCKVCGAKLLVETVQIDTGWWDVNLSTGTPYDYAPIIDGEPQFVRVFCAKSDDHEPGFRMEEGMVVAE